jgi:hypothetical protein
VTFLVPAGQTLSLAEQGDRVTVLSANLPFTLQPEPGGGKFNLCYTGTKQRWNAAFDSLSIGNPSKTAALTLLIWVGFVDLDNTVVEVPATPIQVLTTIASTGVPQPISITDAWFRKGWAYGYASFSNALPNNNQGTIYIGKSKTYQPDAIALGAVVGYDFPPGQLFNLANMYVQGTAGDAVFFDAT